MMGRIKWLDAEISNGLISSSLIIAFEKKNIRAAECCGSFSPTIQTSCIHKTQRQPNQSNIWSSSRWHCCARLYLSFELICRTPDNACRPATFWRKEKEWRLMQEDGKAKVYQPEYLWECGIHLWFRFWWSCAELTLEHDLRSEAIPE